MVGQAKKSRAMGWEVEDCEKLGMGVIRGCWDKIGKWVGVGFTLDEASLVLCLILLLLR